MINRNFYSHSKPLSITLKISLFLVIFCISNDSFSSPIPGVGSSQVSQLLKNIVISEYGFKIGNPEQTFWNLKQDLNSNSTNTFQYFAADPMDKTARFTINIDKFSSPMSFDSYVKKWVKEYPYFGFEILKTQTTKIDNEPCYLVDLAHRKQNKQLRQFVVVRKEFAVVMTCADEIKKFKDTAAQCATLIKDFHWTK